MAETRNLFSPQQGLFYYPFQGNVFVEWFRLGHNSLEIVKHGRDQVIRYSVLWIRSQRPLYTSCFKLQAIERWGECFQQLAGRALRQPARWAPGGQVWRRCAVARQPSLPQVPIVPGTVTEYLVSDHQRCGSMTFWYGSGSVDPCLWRMDPDSDPDPSIFVIDLQDANKKLIF